MKNYFNLIKVYPLASFKEDEPNKAIIYPFALFVLEIIKSTENG